ncbi:hypothetical protein H5410_045204 [Solanum commersonii]|uniref:Uncharacterized protein n=1 Tax=Solanum commersonii TaxID=4109 RepID=A0A9J5XAE1_SOLCO|nr:hypothetical protein H5410_045204 [Solanum commersonii]
MWAGQNQFDPLHVIGRREASETGRERREASETGRERREEREERGERDWKREESERGQRVGER